MNMMGRCPSSILCSNRLLTSFVSMMTHKQGLGYKVLAWQFDSMYCHVIFFQTHQYFSTASFSSVSLPSCIPLTRKLPKMLWIIWLLRTLSSPEGVRWGWLYHTGPQPSMDAWISGVVLVCMWIGSFWGQLPECEHGVVVPRHRVQHFHVLLSSL